MGDSLTAQRVAAYALIEAQQEQEAYWERLDAEAAEATRWQLHVECGQPVNGIEDVPFKRAGAIPFLLARLGLPARPTRFTREPA